MFGRRPITPQSITVTRQVNHVQTLNWGVFVQPLLQQKSNKRYVFWMCVCRLRYPTSNSHTPCFHLWPVRAYSFFRITSKTERLKRTIYIKCVFLMSLQILFETWSKMYIGLQVKSTLFYQNKIKLESSRQIFEKCWNTKFREIRFEESKIVPYRLRNRHL
jgi:hypothetical protein